MSDLCEVHRMRAYLSAECPVCTTAERVKDFAVAIVTLANRLQGISEFYHSHAASITLEITTSAIQDARALLKEIDNG